MSDIVLVVLEPARDREWTRQALQSLAYRVAFAHDVESALQHYRAHRPAAVVIHAELPARGGPELCRRLRALSDVPILMLADDTDEVDELVAFALGADDYLAGTMASKRFAARVNALVRRHHNRIGGTDDAIGFGSILIDVKTRLVTVSGREVTLTRTQFDLLAMLMERPDHVLTRSELVERLWPGWHGDEHILEVQLSRLRSKIKRAGGPRVGEPVRGVGYRLTRRTAELDPLDPRDSLGPLDSLDALDGLEPLESQGA